MNYKIRKINDSEYGVLENFLYKAIFIPPGMEPPPREIINSPELQPGFAVSTESKLRCEAL